MIKCEGIVLFWHLNVYEKVSGSVHVVSGVPQGSVLGPLLFILHTSEFFHIVGNPIVGYADDATQSRVIGG